MGWLRRAGSGLDASGARVTWSVAEGRRGRRWREVVATDAGIRSSLLLELDPDGRFSHLELATATGLLTLHPEGDGTLHGNAVTAHGVAHVRGLPWALDRAIDVEGSAIAVATWRRKDGSWLHDLQVIRPDLSLERTTHVVRINEQAVDAEGLPVLDRGETWPLEEPD